MDKKHKQIKLVLKIVGIFLLVTGLAFTIFGFVDFIRSIGNGSPKYFWALFIGLPFIGIGFGLTISGFRKEITNYIKNESIDAQKDIISQITPEVSNMVKASTSTIEDGKIICANCGTLNDSDDNFCKKCGRPIKNKICPNCGATLDPDSVFCDKCGKKID